MLESPSLVHKPPCSSCKLARVVQFWIDQTHSEIRNKLDAHKVARDDVWEYQMQVMLRQQQINERLIEWWRVKEWDQVLDACCGPEWSSLAVLKRNANWYWNELSQSTHQHLLTLWLNVRNGKAEDLNYDDSTFDKTIYCYAMNNIQATPRTFLESSRVLKINGEMLVADPWLTRWLTDLLLYSLYESLDDISLKELMKSSNRFNSQIPWYFAVKWISAQEYSTIVLSGLLWISENAIRYDISQIIEEIQNMRRWKTLNIISFCYYFHILMNSYYWENLITSGNMAGFQLSKSSFFTCYQDASENEWELSPEVPLEIPATWIKPTRNFFTEVQLPRSKYANELRIWKKWIQKLVPTLMLQLNKY